LDAAASMKKREDQRKPTTHDLRTRGAKWSEPDGGICEQLLWTVADFLFLFDKFFT
jgi:hypothetical protein